MPTEGISRNTLSQKRKPFILRLDFSQSIKQQFSANSCHKLQLSTSTEVQKKWKKPTKTSGDGGYSRHSHIEIHAGIYYRALVNQKGVILANSEPFPKHILPGTLGMRSMFALFNQNFPFTAAVMQWAWVNALAETLFLLPWWPKISEDFCIGTSNFCPSLLQMSTLNWNISDQGFQSKTLLLCLLHLQVRVLISFILATFRQDFLSPDIAAPLPINN